MLQKSSTGKEMIAAVDLGSSHCVTLIAHREAGGGIKIVGLGEVPSRGVRRATIINLEQATQTIERSVAMAEQMCGNNIDSVYLNVSGQHIGSRNSHGTVVVAGDAIVESDVDRAIESARAISLPADQEILNLMPRFYTVDGQEGIVDPLDMVGMRLDVDIHLITANSSVLRNLEKALSNVGLAKEALVFNGYAAAEVVLDDNKKNAGAICIDVGSDTTSFCVYADGAIQVSGVVPIGGRYVSQDINAYTRVGLDNAEKIKLDLVHESDETIKQKEGETREEYRRRYKAADVFDLTKYDPHVKPASVSKNMLIRNVIGARHREIFTLIATELKKHKLHDKLGAGAVIVGGGAQTIGLSEVAMQTLGMQVRVGIPRGIDGVIRHLDDPRYATAIGLLHYAIRDQAAASVETPEPIQKKSSWDSFLAGVSKKFRNLMP